MISLPGLERSSRQAQKKNDEGIVTAHAAMNGHEGCNWNSLDPAPLSRTAAHSFIQNVALPTAWPTGFAHGLLARGGFEVDIDWTDGHFTAATVLSHLGGLCHVRYGEDVVTLETKRGMKYRVDNGLGVVGVRDVGVGW